MPAYLLDTSVIIDLINGRRDRRSFIRNMLRSGDTLGCCTINVIEIYTGMRSGEEPITREYIDSFFYYDVTRAVAERAGSLRFEWKQKGHSLSLADATIATVALSHDLSLLTDNRKHFPMPDLKLFSLPGETPIVG